MMDRQARWRPGWLALASVCVAASGCTEGRSASPGSDAGLAGRRPAATVRGAGATFPKPLYAQWSLRYLESTSVRVAYQAIGSEAGIAAIREGRVDFGANEVPLTSERLRTDGLCQFPVVIGPVVPVVNLPEVPAGGVKLSADDLAGIFLGSITRWDDPAIVEDNPDLSLPAREMIPIVRPPTSGTTWILSRYLQDHSPVWRDAAAAARGSMPFVGVPAVSNEQVARFVAQFKHTIGYVEYSYAEAHDLSVIALRTPGGSYVAPTKATFDAAGPRAELGATDELRVTFSSLDAEDTWPIMGVSYALVRREHKSPEKALAMLRFFRWALTEGAEHAQRLDYLAMPPRFLTGIERHWFECLRSSGGPVWSPSEPRPQPSDAPPDGGSDAGAAAASTAAPPASARPAASRSLPSSVPLSSP